MPYDNAAYSAGSPVAYNQLLASGNYTTRKLRITGAAALIAGTVLGEVLDKDNATVTPGTPVSTTNGTVGDGAVGTWTVDDGAQEGTWHIEITAADTDAGEFLVRRPDGTVEGTGTVAVAYDGEINGTLADGAADWAVGDVIPIAVAYDHSANPWKKSVAAATDGSQNPGAVLMTDADASAADIEAITLETGTVVGSALTLGAGHTIASIRAAMRDVGITIDD